MTTQPKISYFSSYSTWEANEKTAAFRVGRWITNSKCCFRSWISKEHFGGEPTFELHYLPYWQINGEATTNYQGFRKDVRKPSGERVIYKSVATTCSRCNGTGILAYWNTPCLSCGSEGETWEIEEVIADSTDSHSSLVADDPWGRDVNVPSKKHDDELNEEDGYSLHNDRRRPPIIKKCDQPPPSRTVSRRGNNWFEGTIEQPVVVAFPNFDLPPSWRILELSCLANTINRTKSASCDPRVSGTILPPKYSNPNDVSQIIHEYARRDVTLKIMDRLKLKHASVQTTVSIEDVKAYLYPILVTHYFWRGTRYEVFVDTISGKVFANVPQKITLADRAMWFALILGIFLAIEFYRASFLHGIYHH